MTLTSGTITVRRPRVRDLNERFVSRVLPLFKRQTKEVGELLPQLYLHGLALGDFELALRGLLGDGAPLSPASLLRLKTQWQGEYETWKQRRLDDLEVVYLWADGLYVKAGLEDTKAALLVMIGVLTNGQKVVLAVESGQRESKESWGMMLRDLRKRGLKPWRCTIADGHLGLWAALGRAISAAGGATVLEPSHCQCPGRHAEETSGRGPHACCVPCPMLRRRPPVRRSEQQFTTRYRKLAPKAVERLADDWERLVTFYQFPREHWPHLRTTNVVESPFATVRLRTTAAKRFKKVENATALIWKMLQVAESTFRRLKGAELLPAVYAGAQYGDGVQRSANRPQLAA